MWARDTPKRRLLYIPHLCTKFRSCSSEPILREDLSILDQAGGDPRLPSQQGRNVRLGAPSFLPPAAVLFRFCSSTIWAFSPFPEIRVEEGLPNRIRVCVIGWNARSSIFTAGKEKERGIKMCVQLVSEKHKIQLGSRRGNLENQLFGIQIGRLGKGNWASTLPCPFITF